MLRLSKGLCTPDEEAKCQAEHQEFLDRACANCEKLKPADVHPYTAQLLRLNRLRRAGYPLRADELTLREWDDLALVTETLNRIEDRNRWQAQLTALLMSKSA